jgi:hypothetical protein
MATGRFVAINASWIASPRVSHAVTQQCTFLLTPQFRLLGVKSIAEAEVSWSYDWRSFSQYFLVSSPLWDLRPNINSVWNLLTCLPEAPSLTRGRVCLLPVTVGSNCPSSSSLFFLVRIMCTVCPAHFILLDFIVIIIIIIFLLGPNILLTSCSQAPVTYLIWGVSLQRVNFL